VSGGLPIRERPKIGKLLSLEFLDEWDVLVIYKLDRGFRNHLDFVTFYHEFCERYGKKIISVGEEGLDMSTPMGRMFAGILVQFAEWELQSIGDRRPCRAREPVTRGERPRQPTRAARSAVRVARAARTTTGASRTW
jgi:site-specific DNA recombinase